MGECFAGLKKWVPSGRHVYFSYANLQLFLFWLNVVHVAAHTHTHTRWSAFTTSEQKRAPSFLSMIEGEKVANEMLLLILVGWGWGEETGGIIHEHRVGWENL